MTMSNFDILKNILDAQQDTGTQAYDTTATVRRIEGSTAWVHIPGGVDETPVRLTINAKAGDTVQIRVGGGTAWMVGNASAPPTDDRVANIANNTAKEAYGIAESAVKDAETAHKAAESAVASAEQAELAANSAQASADNANEYASRALGNLSTVQSVAETLNWITQHGTMTLTTDTEIDPTHVYFVQDTEGDYVVGNVHYSVVAEPKAADLATYYVLSIDESLNNYVATHLAVTEEGLLVLPAATGYKVLIATGQGTQYTTAGTYIIDANGNTVAKFGASGATIGKSNAAHSVIDANGQRFYGGSNGTQQLANIGYGQGAAESGSAIEPYYTFGSRASGSTIGNYSTAEGYNTTASGYASHSEGRNSVASGHLSHTEGEQTEATYYYAHAEGNKTHATGMASHAEGIGSRASGVASHAEGNLTTASGFEAHAEGRDTIASGADSHAQNRGTIAQRLNQTAIGMYNEADTAGADGEHYGDYVLIIGNGSSDSARSNALTVDWNGNVQAAGQVKSTTETYSLTLPSTVSFGGGLVRNGGIAMLSIINISKLPAGNTTICTLPQGWRPPISVMNKFEAPDNSRGPVRLFINSSGVVTLYNYGAAITASSNISDTITYVLA